MKDLASFCDEVGERVVPLAKSIQQPAGMRIFSRDQDWLRVALDAKLTRLQRGGRLGEQVTLDLLAHLYLLLGSDVAALCEETKRMLVEKNAAYGDSARDPLRVFSSAPPDEQLRVRIDDKLSRIARGSAAGEDPTRDLIGYLYFMLDAERSIPRIIPSPGMPPKVPSGIAKKRSRR